MIRQLTILICDNEHGMGDVTFPDLSELDQLMQDASLKATAGELRKRAKLAGWGRHGGGDYCPGCMEGGI